MAPTVGETSSADDSRLSEEAACMRFVDDLVQYVLDHPESDHPPPVLFDGIYLRTEFSKLFLHLLYSGHSAMQLLDRKIEDVLAECQTAGPLGELPDPISNFLHPFRDLLAMQDPSGIISFLGVVCKLCLRFSDSGRSDCVHLIKAHAKQMIAELYPNYYRDILWMGLYGHN